MDNMIRQVALLTVMMKEIQENRARSEAGEKVKEEGTIEAEEKDPAKDKEKSEALLEETRTGWIELDEEEMQIEGKLITIPPDDDALQKSLEEVVDEPRKTENEVIKHEVQLDYTLFYLQPEKVHVPSEKVEELITKAVNSEDESAEKPPQMIDRSEGCGNNEKGKSE